MDGTLVDTEVLWWETAREVAAGLGHRLSDADAPEVVGRAVADTAAHLIGVTGADPAELPATAAELTDSFFRKVDAGAPLRPGAAALLASLEAVGVPFALVSASPRSVVDAVVAGSLAGVDFAFTLSADDTVRTKPHPDPYRAAARRFAADPAACVAVEDSRTAPRPPTPPGARCWWFRRCSRSPRAGGRSPVAWKRWTSGYSPTA